MSPPQRLNTEVWAIALAITVATAAIAGTVRLACAEPTRRLLEFPFAGLAARPETALGILATNLRLLVGTLAAAVIVQSPWCARRDGRRPSVGLLIVAALDTLIVLEIALNTLVVGAALGAYGARMAGAMLPHGPPELAAYALALASYRRAREQP